MTSAAPRIFSIPPHVAFVDALAAGLMARAGDDPMALARAHILLPNRRAVRALTEAFVRLSGGAGLLLPRLTPVFDVDEDEALGSFADDAAAGAEVPPAIDPVERRLLLCQIVRRWRAARGEPVGVVEALRLADALARTLDQLEFEDKRVDDLLTVVPDDLAAHWQSTLEFLTLLVSEWPNVLAPLKRIERAHRRNLLMRRLIARWEAEPPAELVVAAGMVATAPVVADLLRVVARLPDGLVVLPGLDRDMPVAEWDEIAPVRRAESAPERADTSEGHPQYSFRTLLRHMGAVRDDVAEWPMAGPLDGPQARTALLARAMAPARFTGDWRSFAADPAAFAGLRLMEVATPGEEAQAIALAMRHKLETPGKTAALVTADRALARRVAAHLARWGIAIDDTAGVPLRLTPPGTFLLALADAAAQGFAPVPLLALLKHPLVRQDARLDWLDSVRHLDLVLRGVRPAPGLDAGIAAHVSEAASALLPWWTGVAALLQPLEDLFARPLVALPELLAALRTAAEALAGDALWRGPDGRALAMAVAGLDAAGGLLEPFQPADAPAFIAAFLEQTPARAAFGTHPRLAIYGLLEAQLQRADLMILGGMNEGSWPAATAPDPWLSPAVRAWLGLPGLERRVGLAAHDFVQAMGAPEVLVTRARRDTSAPVVPSRLWLRLAALGGDALKKDMELPAIARAIDQALTVCPAARPEPAPPAMLRPRSISVTQVERLRADPYSFYADRMLGLKKLAPLDEDPTAAERGTFVHRILERWTKEAPDDPARLIALAETMLGKWDHHPLMRALWAPRVLRAVAWAGDEMAAWRDDGWQPLAAEARGRRLLGTGITLTGTADRVDGNAAGERAVIDYKTGALPSKAQLEAGFAPQLGLLAWMVEEGNMPDVPRGPAAAIRYWKLSGGREAGTAKDPLMYNRKPWTDIGEFVDQSVAQFSDVCTALLLGDAPFTAKAHPDYSTRYTDHDQLARVAEWLGRDR